MMPLRERARGRWKAILPALGVDQKYLTGKNGPCPLCPGGRDRWRFDNKNGDGTWICTHCGAGQGIKLAMNYTRLPFKEVAQRIERVLGEAPVEKIRAERSEEEKRTSLNVLWRSGGPIQADDPTDRWLQARDVGMRNYPSCLRTSMRVRHSGPPVTYHPAMLAMVTDPNGKPGTIHKTYLTANGTKAPVEKARMFCTGSVPPGGAVRLAIPGPELGLSEGVESALAAMKLFGVPTWAALSDWGVEKFEPPSEIKRLVVFGDNDSHGAGQRAAYSTAARLSGRIKVDVKIPEKSGTDWNDALLARGSG